MWISVNVSDKCQTHFHDHNSCFWARIMRVWMCIVKIVKTHIAYYRCALKRCNVEVFCAWGSKRFPLIGKSWFIIRGISSSNKTKVCRLPWGQNLFFTQMCNHLRPMQPFKQLFDVCSLAYLCVCYCLSWSAAVAALFRHFQNLPVNFKMCQNTILYVIFIP